MKLVKAYLLLVVYFIAFPSLTSADMLKLKSTKLDHIPAGITQRINLQENVTISDEGVVTIKCDNHQLKFFSGVLTKIFGVRVCTEEYAVANAITKNATPGNFETGGPIAQGEEYRFYGEFSAATLEEMLDVITKTSPYTWQVSNACYVIHPRKGSRLLEEVEKVTADIPPCSLWDAIGAVLDARSEKAKASLAAGLGVARFGAPRLVPEDVNVTGLTFKETPLIDALCRTVEAVPGDDPGFLAIWNCGCWAHEGMIFGVSLIETRKGALRKP